MLYHTTFSIYLEESRDLFSNLNEREAASKQLVNDRKHFNDYNGYDTFSYESINGYKESQEESECEPNDNKTSYPKINSKQNVDFLENDLNDQKNLINRNGTKNIDVPSLKNSRSFGTNSIHSFSLFTDETIPLTLLRNWKVTFI